MEHLLIMAGGTGSRFWPVSTEQKPKQFIDILGVGRTMIQLTFDRFSEVFPPERIWVVTSCEYVELVLEQLPDISKENILPEPCLRNTAPCIAYAAWKIAAKDPDANIVVTPADHLVTQSQEFVRLIRKGLDLSSSGDHIVILGIPPHIPETGYGYVLAENVAEESEFSRVTAFKEKPDKEQAREYLADGRYFWNAGVFIWTVGTLKRTFKKHLPAIAARFDQLSGYFFAVNESTHLEYIYSCCENISVDYGIMERSDNIYLLPAPVGWTDLGTWGALGDISLKDAQMNVVVGSTIKLIDCEDCIVSAPANTQVIVEGLNGYIVVDTGQGLLICKKSRDQEIKNWTLR